MSTFLLGQGAMGSLLGHELALANCTPTLLMKSKKALDVYANNGGAITVMRPSKAESITRTVPIPAVYGVSSRLAGEENIKNLVVATKTYSTMAAISAYLPHISKDTNIVFLQNGMGVVPQIREAFWPNPRDTPNLFHAISTHGAYKESPNVVQHVGLGSLLIAQLPGEKAALPGQLPGQTPEIVSSLLSSRHLAASYVPYPQFALRQMEKLVVNACINPLTTTLDCLNGDLLLAKNIVPTMNRVISECVECFKKEHDVFAMGPEAGVVLSRDRLLSTVLAVCRSTAHNSSSMREDVRRLNTTEIDAINGYIVGIGLRRKVATPVNRMLLDMVRNKVAIERSKENRALHRAVRGVAA